MNLEDYRNQQLVSEVTINSNLFNGEMLTILYHDVTNSAFYITIDALNRMEESDSIGCNTYCIPAVGLWFLSTEAYISTIYKILQAHEKSTGAQATLKTEKIVEKYSQIASYCSGKKITKPKFKNELQEFATFRNTLFHDLTLVKKPTYSHTLFSQRAEKLNEVDLIQSAIIAMNIFFYLKDLIDGIDLMPNIFISNQYEKADVLYDEVILKSFEELLSSKGLSSELSLRLTRKSLEHTVTINPMDCLISYEGPSYPNPSQTKFTVVEKYFTKSREARPMDPDLFKVPNYSK